MKFSFDAAPRPQYIDIESWRDWRWQMRSGLSSPDDFSTFFRLTPQEVAGLRAGGSLFKVQSTPYYTALADPTNPSDPIRRMVVPTARELDPGRQSMPDPLGENAHSPTERIIHRYPDRVLFLVTDICSVYCRYCLRKHFTGNDQAVIKPSAYDEALAYIRRSPGVREVILSGGDPLTLSDERLDRVLFDLRQIDHVEIIRLGTRMPVVCPMRVTEELVCLLRRYHPVVVMTHFNHPQELTEESANALVRWVDNGFPVFNQMVLLNGINNHAAIVQALSRRLLFLRVKPYYMFHCDPSQGTDHLRTPVENSLAIQRELWGRLSGLALPNLSLDIPYGGGKVGLVPDFLVARTDAAWSFRGWDGLTAEYIDPEMGDLVEPELGPYLSEWNELCRQTYGRKDS